VRTHEGLPKVGRPLCVSLDSEQGAWEDNQVSCAPLLGQRTPRNTRQQKAMDLRKGGTTLRGKRFPERTMSQAKLDMLTRPASRISRLPIRPTASN